MKSDINDGRRDSKITRWQSSEKPVTPSLSLIWFQLILTFRPKLENDFGRKLKWMCKWGIFARTKIRLTFLLRTTIKVEIKHKTKQKANVWKYQKAIKMTRNMGLRFNRERTYIISSQFIMVLFSKSICLYSIWSLETRKTWCPGAWSSLLGREDKNWRTGLPGLFSQKVSLRICMQSPHEASVTKGYMHWPRSSETKQRVEAKRLTPKQRRLLLSGTGLTLLLQTYVRAGEKCAK